MHGASGVMHDESFLSPGWIIFAKRGANGASASVDDFDRLSYQRLTVAQLPRPVILEK
jgi:hypothetical protein